MIVIDEYIAARVMGGDWPDELPDDELGLPASRHWRLLQALHGGRGGQLTRILDPLSPAGRDGIRHPHPEVLQVLDPRPLLDDAAILAARFGGTGLLTAEALAAGLAHGEPSALPAALAALALEHGLAVVSADSDFARFPELTRLNPLLP